MKDQTKKKKLMWFGNVFRCLAQFHLSCVGSKFQTADCLCCIIGQWTYIHKHTRLRNRTRTLDIELIQLTYTVAKHPQVFSVLS